LCRPPAQLVEDRMLSSLEKCIEIGAKTKVSCVTHKSFNASVYVMGLFLK